MNIITEIIFLILVMHGILRAYKINKEIILHSYDSIGRKMVMYSSIIILLLIAYKTKGHENMKYKKQIIIGLILLIIFSVFFLKKTKVNRKIAKDLEIKIPYNLHFYYKDSHGGFFGDGVALGRAELKDIDIDKLLKAPEGHWNWTKTPIPEELNTMLYGCESYHSDLAIRLEMKSIENGYWI